VGEILVIRIVETAQTGLTDLGESKGSSGQVKVCDVAEKVVLLADDAEVVPAKPIIKSQPWSYAIAVLGIKAKVVLVGVASRVSKVLETTTCLGTR